MALSEAAGIPCAHPTPVDAVRAKKVQVAENHELLQIAQGVCMRPQGGKNGLPPLGEMA